MRKLLLTMVLGLAASTGSYAASCVSGSTISNLSGSCEVFNGANSWTLSNFGADNIVSTGYANGVNGSNASTYVAVILNAYSVGNQFGFSVTFTMASPTDLFTAQNSGGVSQEAAFNTNFTVTANNGGSNISQYGVYITGWSPLDSTTGDLSPSVRVNMGILDPGSISNLQADQSLLFRNPVSIGGISQPDFSVVNAYQINSGENGARAQITSYTSYFLPAAPTQTPVPEPTTFVLMGAGLVGVAVLRRRQ